MSVYILHEDDATLGARRGDDGYELLNRGEGNLELLGCFEIELFAIETAAKCHSGRSVARIWQLGCNESVKGFEKVGHGIIKRREWRRE